MNDLKLLLEARGFSFDENVLPFGNYYSWEKHQKNGYKEIIEISTELFDNENKLKYININNWDENYVVQKYETIASKDDDLPF